MDIFKEVESFANANHYVDVQDKIPVFLCSIGAHIFNGLNRCGTCPFEPDDELTKSFTIDECIMRHKRSPIYAPMSHVADTRLNILMRGAKGSGKSVLLDLFLAPNTGLLFHPQAFELGVGFRTDIGPNSITEAGMFGSVDEDGNIVGRPLAREMCGGFLGFEEMSSLMDASSKEHSIDMKNQLLTSTDNGRVKKVMRAGWVEYTTRYTLWGGTQPARMDLESGLDRRFFIIYIVMSPDKERLYKEAQAKQTSMGAQQRATLVAHMTQMQEWLVKRQLDVSLNPPTAVHFTKEVNEWIMQDEVRGHEAELFRRLCLGYAMMREKYHGGGTLVVEMTPYLKELLDACLRMRRSVMDADLNLIKATFWNKEMPRSTLLKSVSEMITNRDYQAAKRWIEDNLLGQMWYSEYRNPKQGRGRRGVMTYIGYRVDSEAEAKPTWGENDEIKPQ